VTRQLHTKCTSCQEESCLLFLLSHPLPHVVAACMWQLLLLLATVEAHPHARRARASTIDTNGPGLGARQSQVCGLSHMLAVMNAYWMIQAAAVLL
jgi:hypothetical protein